MTPSHPEAGGAEAAPAEGIPQRLTHLALLWLAGLSIRVTVLAIPPLLPTLRREFDLNHAGVAAMTTLPLLLFGAAATVGSGVVSFAGARRTLVAGLLVAAAASAVRAVAPSAAVLLGFTFVMGLGIAAVQPALPSLVQSWFPRTIGRATAVYVNGMLVSEAVAASVTLPLLVPLFGGWQGALAFWSLPVGAAAVLVAFFSSELPAHETRPARWLPSWTEGRTWRVGLLQGAGSLAYFGSNAMIPVYLESVHRGDLVGWSLTVLNSSQLLASVAVAVLVRRMRIGTFVWVNGIPVAAGAVMLVADPDRAILWSFVVGFCTAIVFTLSLAVPALLERGPEVARLSAGMLTIGYGIAFALPLVGGALWDATGSAWAGFAPPIAAGLGAIVIGGFMRDLRELRE